MTAREIIKGHLKSSRFIVVMATLFLTFIGAVITMFEPKFPFLVFAGIMNGSGVVTYISKTLEPGARERRKGENLANGKVE